MSDLFIRSLAQQAATHPDVETAVMTALRTTLPRVIESILREHYAGESVRLYVAKVGHACRAERDALIRAQFSGANQAELAQRYCLTVRQVRNILKVKFSP
jgi:Mor family transcriptional regulator